MIRSNCSPATGSKRLPSLVSTLSMPFNAALISVNASARGLTSVATTCSQCAAASSAWMPLPVPTSTARPAGRRGVTAASHDAVGVYGRDEAHGVVGAAREPVERHQQLLGRHDPRSRPKQRAVDRCEPERAQCIDAVAGQRRRRRAELDRQLQEAEPDARRNARIVEPALVHDHVGGVGARPVLAEQLDDGRPRRTPRLATHGRGSRRRRDRRSGRSLRYSGAQRNASRPVSELPTTSVCTSCVPS